MLKINKKGQEIIEYVLLVSVITIGALSFLVNRKYFKESVHDSINLTLHAYDDELGPNDLLAFVYHYEDSNCSCSADCGPGTLECAEDPTCHQADGLLVDSSFCVEAGLTEEDRPLQGKSCNGNNCCGNGELNESYGEECDGSVPSGAGAPSCATYGYYNTAPGDDLVCNNDCKIDPSNCERCGDGTLQAAYEDCEPNPLDVGGKECSDVEYIGAGGRGNLNCFYNCTIDASGCHMCGDGVKQPEHEQCDPNEEAGVDDDDWGMVAECNDVLRPDWPAYPWWAGYGFLPPCLEDCTFDVSNCEGCADRVINGPEECEILDEAGDPVHQIPPGSCSDYNGRPEAEPPQYYPVGEPHNYWPEDLQTFCPDCCAGCFIDPSINCPWCGDGAVDNTNHESDGNFYTSDWEQCDGETFDDVVGGGFHFCSDFDGTPAGVSYHHPAPLETWCPGCCTAGCMVDPQGPEPNCPWCGDSEVQAMYNGAPEDWEECDVGPDPLTYGDDVLPDPPSVIVDGLPANCTRFGPEYYETQSGIICIAGCDLAEGTCPLCGDGLVNHTTTGYEEDWELCDSAGPVFLAGYDTCDDFPANLPEDGHEWATGNYYDMIPNPLACDADCEIDRDGCTEFCGNSAIDDGEVVEACDIGSDPGFGDDEFPADPAPNDCTDYNPGCADCSNFYNGDVSCSNDCLSIDISDCDDYCGDGTLNGPQPDATDELCDWGGAGDMGGNNCDDIPVPGQSFDYTGGILACQNDCDNWDTSDCYYCGDGDCNDTTPPAGQPAGTEECGDQNIQGGECFSDCSGCPCTGQASFVTGGNCGTLVSNEDADWDTSITVSCTSGGNALCEGNVTILCEHADGYWDTTPTNNCRQSCGVTPAIATPCGNTTLGPASDGGVSRTCPSGCVGNVIGTCSNGTWTSTDSSGCILITYTWSGGSWGACSAVCGGGTQSFSGGTCTRDTDGAVVAASYCTRIPDNGDTQACNTAACTYTWGGGSWGACSAVCGGGTQTYAGGSCTRDQDGATVVSTLCTIRVPDNGDTQACNTAACTYTWRPGSWGSCSVPCGGGTQTYGGGVCIRDQDGANVSSSFCAPVPDNGNTQACNTAACTYTWGGGSWGSCSVPCGGGTQTYGGGVCIRDQDGATVVSTLCTIRVPDNGDTQACNTQACACACSTHSDCATAGGCSSINECQRWYRPWCDGCNCVSNGTNAYVNDPDCRGMCTSGTCVEGGGACAP